MEDVKKVKNAAEAKAIKDKDLITTDGILDLVSGRAKFGVLYVNRFVPMDVIYDLVVLGFKVSLEAEEHGDKTLKIEW